MTSNSAVQRVLVISSGMAIFTYSNQETNQELGMNDEQLLSGFLGAFQSFSNDMGTEINAVKFKQLSIFYRVIKKSDNRSDEASIVFIADQNAEEKDIRIRMEYACQIFVHNYFRYLSNNMVDSALFSGFKKELEIILNSERDKIEDLLPKSFLQVLLKELQNSVPIKQLEKMLKKYDFVYDQSSKTLIVPGDLSKEFVDDIVKHLQQITTSLFGRGTWDNAFKTASDAVKGG